MQTLNHDDDTTAGRDADPPLFQLFNEIGIIDQLATAQLERLLPDGLRAPHFHVLNHLTRLGDGRTPVAIARAFQVTKGAMTNTLQRLEARSLIRIEPDPVDGRAKRVFLTDDGRRMRDRAVGRVAGFMADLAPVVSDDDLAVLLQHLMRLRMHLDRARD